MPDRPRSPAAAPTVFVAGAVFAMVTSTGLVEERSSAGSLNVAVVTNALVTFAAMLVLCLVQRRVDVSARALLPEPSPYLSTER
jgi:hypothetical protein